MMKDFRKRFLVSIVLTVPILVLSPTIQGWIGYDLEIPYWNIWISLLAVSIFLYGGYPFLKGLYKEVGKKEPGMMTLIGLAITVAFVYSMAVVLGLSGKVFFWELATLIDVMLLGHWIEMRSVMGASSALKKLSELIPEKAHLKTDSGNFREVDISELKKDDIIRIKPGEKVPVDGIIAKGSGSIDESMLTGESVPVSKKEGDEVIGGSLNGDSSLEIKVSRIGKDSYLSKVMEMVKESQKQKSRTQRLADKAAKWLTVISISVGVLTLSVWLITTDDLAFSIERMATVMVITCPHALGLAIPLVTAVSTSHSARKGLLIRNRTPFERAGKISKIVFDKTGTLTKGNFSVVKITSFAEEMSEKDIIELMASLEDPSEHPISKGIREKGKEMGIENREVSDFENIKGEGIRGAVDGKNYTITGRAYLEKNGIEVPGTGENEDITTVYLTSEKSVLAMVGLSDQLRDDSRETVQKLRDMKIECWMLTGDGEDAAKRVAQLLDLNGYFSGVLPNEKGDRVKQLQSGGMTVAMVGDGVNDAPALAQSDIGIAIGSGTDIAAETADIVLVESDLAGVVNVIRFGKSTYGKIVQNLIYATGYNVVAIPLAAGALYWAGIMISPAVGAGLMSLSTVVVAINARLLSAKLD